MDILDALDVIGKLPDQATMAKSCTREIRVLRKKVTELEQSNIALEMLRPFWAQGFSSDSVAAQSSGNALTDIWELLGVANQTAAMEKLRELVG